MPLAMKKTLHLYIIREIIVPFLLGYAIFTIVLLMGRLINLADMVIAKGVPLLDVLRLIFYMLPYFSLITIPMSFLLAVLLAFGRLSSDNEITAMKSSGISLYGLLPPVIVFTFLAYIVTTAITVYALPWGNTAYKTLLYEALNTRVNISLKDQVFNDDFPGLMIYVDHYNQEKHTVSGVLIYDQRKQTETATIFARGGFIMADPAKRTLRLRLLDGGVHRINDKSGYELYEFGSYDVSINFNQSYRIVPTINEVDMSFQELWSVMKLKGVDPRIMRNLYLEFHRRLAFPFACFVFAFIGIPLGLQNRRSGKSMGFFICIMTILVYYVFLAIGKTLGQQGSINPALSMWLPNLFFIAAGIYLFKKTAAEQIIPIFDFPLRFQKWVETRISTLRSDLWG